MRISSRAIVPALALGLVLVTAAILAVIRSSGDPSPSSVPRTQKTITADTGEALRVLNGDIQEVTVYGLTRDVPAPSFFRVSPGDEIAVADVRVCAGPKGTHGGPTASFFDLVLSDDSRAGPLPLKARRPAFEDIKKLGKNECDRGFLTFQIKKDKQAVFVRYLPEPLRTYRWRL